MAYCTNCGQQIAEGAKFCANCGTPVGQAVRPQRETVYEGSLHKCPNCGEILNSFTANCPTCGYELRGVKPHSTVEDLSQKVEMASSLDDKIELITNFYIPNTKEDIYDFFILAVSNLENKRYDTDDAWRAKLEQAYHKARLSFGNTSEFQYLEKLYNRTCKKVSKRERGISAVFRRSKVAFITALVAGVGLTILIAGIVMMVKGLDGYILLLMSMACFCSLPVVPELIEDNKKKSKSKKNNASPKNINKTLPIGKDAEDFIHENYDDMAEFLRSLGFRNIVTKPEKKGLLDTEGAVKGISIGGNTEFCEYDEFAVNSKIIIRYYSNNYARRE